MQNVQSIHMLYGAKSRTILLTLSCYLAHSSSYDVATKLNFCTTFTRSIITVVEVSYAHNL